MASSSEICLNCRQTFYQQSLHPLKLAEFQFAGHPIASLACFVASNSTYDCPKVCNTCLALLNDSHIASKRAVLDNVAQKLPAYVCATCLHLSPSNNLMNMRLTVVKFEGHEISLVDCVKVCMEKTLRADVNLMICLACLSAVAEEYRRRAEQGVKSDKEVVPELVEIKTEPAAEGVSEDDDDHDMETLVKSETDDDDLPPVFTGELVKHVTSL
jgi:hypothetical protein